MVCGGGAKSRIGLWVVWQTGSSATRRHPACSGPQRTQIAIAQPFLCELIRRGFVHRLFAGNARATHDIEPALFGTSLGVYLDRGSPAKTGHAHHLRAINRIRRAGGIRAAVEQGILNSGLMYECLRVVGRIVVTNTGCPQLFRDLTARGCTCLMTPLSEFIKAGGSAKCLTLRLDGEDAAAWK
jgi:hypothetical protein